METKQTAIEWLYENLIPTPYLEEDFKYNKSIWDRAKKMEKEKIQLARKESYTDGWLEATQYIMKYTKQEDHA